MDPDDDRVVAINQTGVFDTTHPAIEHIIRAQGHVVVVAPAAAFLPGPLGSVIADGIERRAARTMAPRAWTAVALLRGVLNIVVDAKAAGDHAMHELVRETERRVTRERFTSAEHP